MEEQTSSPLPNKVEQEVKHLSFTDALKYVVKGKKITRLEWMNDFIYGELVENELKLHKEDGIYYRWVISTGDMLATDWVVFN